MSESCPKRLTIAGMVVITLWTQIRFVDSPICHFTVSLLVDQAHTFHALLVKEYRRWNIPLSVVMVNFMMESWVIFLQLEDVAIGQPDRWSLDQDS